MENFYRHQLLIEQHQRDCIKQAENDRLVQLVSHSTPHIQPVVELSSLINQWWTNRWDATTRNQNTKRKMVIPEA